MNIRNVALEESILKNDFQINPNVFPRVQFCVIFHVFTSSLGTLKKAKKRPEW